MLPVISEEFNTDFTDVKLPSKDFGLNISAGKMNGTVEDLAAVRQAIYFMLNTERYDHLIYSWNYGVELSDLFGQPFSFVVPEIERRVKECLTQDSRITSVGDFSAEKKGNAVYVTFTVYTIYGQLESGVTVNV